MDDSQVNPEKKVQSKAKGKPKPFDTEQSRSTQGRDELVEKLKAELGIEEPTTKQATAKSSESEVISAVERTTEEGNLSEEVGAKQTDSERTGRASGTLTADEPATQKGKTHKPAKAKSRSKKYQEVSEGLDRTKTFPLPEAVDMVKKLSYAKFNATLEAHINTAQTGIAGYVSLPYASGKKLRILAFGKGSPSSGNILVGNDSTIEDIEKGKVDFDLVITTPEWMPKLAKVAKVLGPRGLMPSPKNGTITKDLKSAIESFQAGKTEYATEAKAAVIHLALGKLNQPNEELAANIKTLLQTLGKSKIKKVTLSPTMGPSVKLDLASI